MADLSNVTFQPQNPDALFSPDQWLNQFSNFNSKALPWPSSYTGYPTDAMGNFINPQTGSGIPTQAQWQANQAAPPPAAQASTPGTTINSTPAAAQMTPQDLVQRLGGGANAQGAGDYYGNYLAAQANLSPQQQQIQAQNRAIGQQRVQLQDASRAAANLGGGFGQSPGGAFNPGPSASFMPSAQPAAPQQAAPPAAAAPGGLTYPQVLALLANPGKVTTPGATVPASATSAQPSSGALQSFLSNWKPATSGPASGFQQDFSKTLRGMGY